MRKIGVAMLLLVSLSVSAFENASRNLKGIVYKTVGDKALVLNLHLPETRENKRLPLLVWLHGGGWMRGSQDDFPASNPVLARSLSREGYAVASIGYRLSGEAVFPAPVQDVNDALDFLAERSADFGVLAEKVVVMGRSAGGHLATLIAMSNHHPDVDFYRKPRYRVVAAVTFFGPVDLLLENNSRELSSERMAKSPTARFLGGIPSDHPVLAKKASPLSYVSKNSPPVMMLHGEQDRQVPVAHSLALKRALDEHGVHNTLLTDKDGRHSDKVFDSERNVIEVVAFVKKHLPLF